MQLICRALALGREALVSRQAVFSFFLRMLFSLLMFEQMRGTKIHLSFFFLLFSLCQMTSVRCGVPSRHRSYGDTTLLVPLGGNTWCQPRRYDSLVIGDSGIRNWQDSRIRFYTYIRLGRKGTLHLRLHGKTDGSSALLITINGISHRIRLMQKDFAFVDAGTWQLRDTGYVRIVLSGISRTASCFACLDSYEVSGTAVNAQTCFVRNNEGNFFYWGRRGPSVHLNYPLPDSFKAMWFYNEVTVPRGQDVVGSYFMVAGFREGYFGIQVNSDTERRILFSVWSPYQTDDPNSIPEDERIALIKKGAGVHGGSFGSEGSGGQSYLRYHWKAGVTYRFLVSALPDMHGTTTYTAYFFSPQEGHWRLIASFRRPKTHTYLRGLYSFLENFIPGQGNVRRRVLFNNAWIADSNGSWMELDQAMFTYDNTAAHRYRMDYAGGVEGGQFFLQNDGFFNHYTPLRSRFVRPRTGRLPRLDLLHLP